MLRRQNEILFISLSDQTFSVQIAETPLPQDTAIVAFSLNVSLSTAPFPSRFVSQLLSPCMKCV